MIVGWAINSAMILLAAATFFKSGIQVERIATGKVFTGTAFWVIMPPWYLLWHCSWQVSPQPLPAVWRRALFFGHIRRIIPHQRQPFTGRCIAIARCNLLLIFSLAIRSRDLLFPQNDSEHSEAVYRFPASGTTSSRVMMGKNM